MDSLTTRFEKEVFTPYLDILKAAYRIHPLYAHAEKIWEEKLNSKELVNGPYLEKAQVYETGDLLESLSLHEQTRKTIRKRLGDKRSLYRHQTDALKLLLAGKNAVIATGTSSGKTLCYQIPILDDLVRNPAPGLRAVIIYPLNALVNDQLTEWEEMLKDHPHISFARFTGQTPDNQIEYVNRLRDVSRDELVNEQLTQQELHRRIELKLADKLRDDNKVPNRLNHREDIRAKRPQILITNFSMLEYLLERPIDSPIFDNANLKFLVLDEAHAYRGVQATEIAFLIRRLKDRLGIERLTCIATSATLGKKGDVESQRKVRKFATDMFGEIFDEANPIYGTMALPAINQPGYKPSTSQYIQAAIALRTSNEVDVRGHLGINIPDANVAALLAHDENLYGLRKEILTKPTLLSEAAKLLWPTDPDAENGLLALLEIVATAKRSGVHEDFLPTRLHYFVRAQDGLHICLHKECPGRKAGQPAFFVSRKSDADGPDGYCPECHQKSQTSKLVEVVTCRKCGYLFGALQDLGPRNAQTSENDPATAKIYFDSFSTELGWAADSFWSYFCIEDELPYPKQPRADEEDDIDDLFLNPAQLEWCVICGKKHDSGAGDNCTCQMPHLRKIQVFHRQCPHSGKPKDRANLYNSQKKPLTACPNCGARNSSGLEPVRRFQESDDETGLAMAIPLAHFQVNPLPDKGKAPRKLLCFTDHRQRAAAFPSLLEEETFGHDMGRKIVEIVSTEEKPLALVALGERLADFSDLQSNNYDPDFFLPVSRYPDEELDAKGKRNLWVAETFSYFGIPDAARESAEDLGLVAVEYRLDKESSAFYALLNKSGFSQAETTAALQILLGFVRQRKAFTLPKGRVRHSDSAFGRVTADIAYVLRREGVEKMQGRYIEGWLPRLNKDGSYRNNIITDYLRRLLQLPPQEVLNIADKIWQFLISEFLLIENKQTWKLDHERICVKKASARYVCPRCGYVTAYSARQCCPRKECDGNLELRSFDPSRENIVARWVADQIAQRFTSLKSEEHSAQISKQVAKRIEDEFRAEGVNLLSSTTTFEMGINIGDLQKVLLRNAPPTSASYVQRVGRAGRGNDKNSVCVTLCRRTKYDADAWQEPPRLMSGEVRTPTVFTQNSVIAQRHFNAVLFAKFLRDKVLDKQLLGQLKQEIRLEPFLPVTIRNQPNLPKTWLLFPPDLHLDFPSWLDVTNEQNVFNTSSRVAILSAVGTFTDGKIESLKKYTNILTAIADELSTLLKERQQIFSYGGHTADVERSINALLRNGIINVLARRGFLPRYAFPLDVVSLETGSSRWSRESDVELSRDRGIAIAEFAPGAQVIAHKKVFTSEGLYIVSKRDEPQRHYYVKCRNCEQIRTASSTPDELKGNCSVCNKPVNPVQDIKIFVEPEAFSVRIDKQSEGSARHRRTTLIRQRQSLTHFIDSVKDDKFENHGLFKLALKVPGTLFRYNVGPKGEGFILCPHCGYSSPKNAFPVGKKHQRLRVFSGNMDCMKQPWSKEIAYGHQFQSFCLIARPIVPTTSIESLAFALRKGLCAVLDIEPSDIGVSWRWLANKTDRSGEIILYDYAPGGAGFVKEGYDSWSEVVAKAVEICKGCKCERACYDCLKDYGNQSYHDKLNRISVVDWLSG